jgi:hypothetical protein
VFFLAVLMVTLSFADRTSETQRRMEAVRKDLQKSRQNKEKKYVSGDPLPSDLYLYALKSTKKEADT